MEDKIIFLLHLQKKENIISRTCSEKWIPPTELFSELPSPDRLPSSLNKVPSSLSALASSLQNSWICAKLHETAKLSLAHHPHTAFQNYSSTQTAPLFLTFRYQCGLFRAVCRAVLGAAFRCPRRTEAALKYRISCRVLSSAGKRYFLEKYEVWGEWGRHKLQLKGNNTSLLHSDYKNSCFQPALKISEKQDEQYWNKLLSR